ncbi:MAG: hypothetical protein NTZ35_20360 [Ignavibacteriales bacterium]|nr:hypothetical protein [Ignavibacteriales bacterium]
MSYRRSIMTVVAILTLSQLLNAQGNFRLQVVGGGSLNSPTTGVFSNWGDGWTLGGGFSHSISPSIDLALNIGYARYPYQGRNLQLAFPAVVGLRWSISGQSSNVIEASIAARVSTSALFIDPFLSLTTGLYRFNISEIIISTWFDSSPQNMSRSTYIGSGVSTTRGFAAIGAGFSIPLGSSIRVTLEGRFAQTFHSKEIFVPLLTTVQFDL